MKQKMTTAEAELKRLWIEAAERNLTEMEEQVTSVITVTDENDNPLFEIHGEGIPLEPLS